MKEIYIYGCGGVGKELAEHIKNSTEYELVGFIDDDPRVRECVGYQSRTLEEILETRDPTTVNAIITIGEPAVREIVSNKLSTSSANEITLDISAFHGLHNSSTDKGALIHFGSYVSVNTRIGKSCFINKNVIVGHDCSVGDYSVLCPNVILGGNVSIGKNSFIGTGVVIRNGISIGENVIIGMGAVVVKDIEDNAIAFGNPARRVGWNTTGRVFSV